MMCGTDDSQKSNFELHIIFFPHDYGIIIGSTNILALGDTEARWRCRKIFQGCETFHLDKCNQAPLANNTD